MSKYVIVRSGFALSGAVYGTFENYNDASVVRNQMVKDMAQQEAGDTYGRPIGIASYCVIPMDPPPPVTKKTKGCGCCEHE